MQELEIEKRYLIPAVRLAEIKSKIIPDSLSEEEFAALSHGVSTNVAKTRYQVDFDGWKGELNIFSGRHEGLVVLEFEFPNESGLARFLATTRWDLLDITNLKWLAFGRLAETSVANLAEKLAQLA